MPVINGVHISTNKLGALKKVLPESKLRLEYEQEGLSDPEIADKYGASKSWVCKLRKIYGIQTNPNYGLHRNILRFTPLTGYQRQVLHGTLMGDSLIGLQASGTGYWKCMHCLAQEQYLLKKAEVLKPFIAKISYGERPFKPGGKLFPFACARSYALPQFTEYRQKFYPDGVKTITRELLEELTATGLAYWWQDDGLKGQYSFNIVTYDNYFRGHKDEAKTIFKANLGLDVSITWNRDEGNICFLRTCHALMWSYIKPEITPDMIYKLPKKFQWLN